MKRKNKLCRLKSAYVSGFAKVKAVIFTQRKLASIVNVINTTALLLIHGNKIGNWQDVLWQSTQHNDITL